MRIRRRPPFSSFPSFASPTTASPHSLQDPSLHPPHHAPNGRDAIANNGGGEREGKGGPELHSGDHPPKDPLAQDPFYRRSPLRPPLPRPTPPRPPPPCLDPYDETTGCSGTHLTDVGLVKVQDFGQEEETIAAAAAKSEEERGTLLDAKMGWDDNAQLVNSNMRIDGISGASILLEAARQLEAATEKRKKGRGGCNARTDDDDCESDEKLKEKKKSILAKESGCGSVDESLRNNCTGIVGKDNDGYHNGDGPAAVREQEEKGGVAVNGSGRSNGKKRRSPAVLMEGSRCSRVNGRGWRCCQQTLVGYSLCEHHLGKGRLRSMSSVRGQIGATTRPKKKKKNSKTPTDQEEEDEEKRAVQLQQQQKKNEPSEVDGTTTDMDREIEGVGETSEDKSTKKRKAKMGTVKARSISSLLHEADLSAPPPSQQPAQSPITVDDEAIV